LFDQLQGKPLILKGDGQADSPGFSAQYMDYQIADDGSGYLLSTEAVDKRETNLVSTQLEVYGGLRGLHLVIRRKLHVVKFVSDQHPIMSYIFRT
jgi:hypothetical protein